MIATLSQSFSATSRTWGGEKDRAALLTDFPHEIFQQMTGSGIKPDKGFVHDQQTRFMDECGNDSQFLPHAMGIRTDGLCQVTGEFE